MARGIIGSYPEFEKFLPDGFSPKNDTNRFEAVKHYFSLGGVFSLAPNGKDWPVMRYPNRRQLVKKIESLVAIKAKHEKSLKTWQNTFNEAKRYHTIHNVKKLKEPLYWQHVIRSAFDSEYREDSNKVKLPVHLVSDQKWKPLVKMFLSDVDYRKQLTETVENSIVYKGNKKVAQYADVLQQFRMDQSKRKINELQKKIAELEKTEKVLNILMKWAPP